MEAIEETMRKMGLRVQKQIYTGDIKFVASPPVGHPDRDKNSLWRPGEPLSEQQRKNVNTVLEDIGLLGRNPTGTNAGS